MGGSGGGGYFSGRTDAEKLRREVREEEERTLDQAFDAEVSGIISGLLAEINDRDVEGTSRILDEVVAELSEETEGSVSLMFGGSVAKHTYVDGLSDVDALVLFKPAEAEQPPADVRHAFAERLRSAFGRDAVREGDLAVTLTLEGKEIQLLPAIKAARGVRISDATGSAWAQIDPTGFARDLSDANRNLSGKLIPTIKLVKSALSGLPPARRLTGYHVEALALRCFADYPGPRVPKAMIHHFFASAPELVMSQLRDRTGQSSFIDEYLGPPQSAERRIVADVLARMGRRLKNADGARSADRWSEILGGDRS